MQNIKEEGVIYTPQNLGMFMGEMLSTASKKLNISVQSILDPSVGNGDLLFAASQFFPESLLMGIDINNQAAEKSQDLFLRNNVKNYSFKVANYLLSQPNLLSPEYVEHEPVDAIIANPPYVRTQNLNTDLQNLAATYNISGRIDLYQAFIVEMTQQLKNDGIICMITSNRYLYTKSGESTRKFLRENYNILEIIDLGDTKVFDAAVLPAIFLGQKQKKADNSNIKFKKIYETENKKTIPNTQYESIFDALNMQTGESKNVVSTSEKKIYTIEGGLMQLPKDPKEPWTLSTIQETNWANEIIQDNQLFSDIFKVHVGIKTTADKVFIRDNWKNEINFPESNLLYPLIYSKNIQKWTTNNVKLNRTILYPYTFSNNSKNVINLNEYPLTKKYLSKYREQLEKRTYLKKAGREWFEIWVPQNPNLMKKTKVVFPDISEKPKFSVDTNGYMVDGNCYWLSLKEGMDPDYIYLAVIIANSTLMQKFHDIKFQNKLYSSKRRYLTQYVSNYPIPDINQNESIELVKICKKITQSADPEQTYSRLINHINSLIEKSLLR